jgi:integrase
MEWKRVTENKNGEPKISDFKAMFIQHYLDSKSKNTARLYKSGLERFEKWYGKTAQEIYEEHRANKATGNPMLVRHFQDVLAKWNKYLIEEEHLSINSARSNCVAVVQYFSFVGEPIRLGLKTERTQKTYIPQIDEFQRMYAIADLRGKLILSLGLDLAWRVNDFLSLKKSDIPDLNQECPIPIQKTTQKETEISCTFISCESVALLKEYMPNLPTDNEYLFPNTSKGHAEDSIINSIIQDLATKIQMPIPKGKRFTFHAFRKRFLSTAMSLGIQEETMYLLVGKSIDKSHEVYFGDVKLKNAFVTVRVNNLPLIKNGNGNGRVTKLSEEVTKLQAEIDALKLQNFNADYKFNILVTALEEHGINVSKLIKQTEAKYSEENPEAQDRMEEEGPEPGKES